MICADRPFLNYTYHHNLGKRNSKMQETSTAVSSGRCCAGIKSPRLIQRVDMLRKLFALHLH